MVLSFPGTVKCPLENLLLKINLLTWVTSSRSVSHPQPPFLRLSWFCISFLSTISNNTMCLVFQVILPSLEPLIYVMELLVEINLLFHFRASYVICWSGINFEHIDEYFMLRENKYNYLFMCSSLQSKSERYILVLQKYCCSRSLNNSLFMYWSK